MAAPRSQAEGRTNSSTRDRIISAAEKLFDEVGIEKANVADIADSAGIHRVTFYRHFADRDAILDEVLDRRSRPILDRAAARLANSDRFPEDLAYVMVAAVDETRHMPDVFSAMTLVEEGGTFRSPAIRVRFLNRAAEVVKPHLVTAQERGQMRSDLSVDETVKWLLHVCLSWLFLSQDESPAKILDECKTYVMAAIVEKRHPD